MAKKAYGKTQNHTGNTTETKSAFLQLLGLVRACPFCDKSQVAPKKSLTQITSKLHYLP